MGSGILAKLKNYTAASAEVIAAEPLQATSILAKAALANRRYGLGPDLFFLYDLHKRPIRTWGDYIKASPDLERLLSEVNWRHGRELSGDKVLATVRAVERGIAVAPILAVVGRRKRDHAFQAFEDVARLTAFLQAETTPDELFVKPADGEGGEGIFLAHRSDRGWIVDEKPVTSEALAARLLAHPKPTGLMIQPWLSCHPAISAVSAGRGLATVRMIIALTESGPEPLWAVQKLIVGEAATDNFQKGKAGNLVASIDLATGRLSMAVGRGWGRTHLVTRFERHPSTGGLIEDFELPCWNETIELAKAVSLAFPEMPLLGLDLAITPEGPLLIETNSSWGPVIMQAPSGRGARAVLRPVLPRLAAPAHVREAAMRLLDRRY